MPNPEKTYFIEKLRTFLFLAYAFVLPFSEWFTFRLNNVILILLCAIWAAGLFYAKQPKRIYKHPLLLFSGAILFVQLIDLFLGGDMQKVGANLFMKLPFLLFPIVLASSSPEEQSIKTISQFFIGGCLTAVLVSFRFLLTGESGNPAPTYFAQYEEYFVLHRPYFGMYLLLAICFLYYDLKKKFNLFPLVLMLVFVAFIFFIQAKMSILTFFTLIVSEAANVKVKWIRKTFTYLLLSIFFILAVFLTNYYLANRENVNQKQGNDRFYILSINTRVVHYRCALEIIRQNPIIGVGCGSLTTLLDECYINQKTQLAENGKHYNVHNEFLEETARHGLLGLTIYLISFFFFFRNAIRRQDNLYLQFLLIIVLASMTETVFSRAQGVLMITFFNALFFLKKEHVASNQES